MWHTTKNLVIETRSFLTNRLDRITYGTCNYMIDDGNLYVTVNTESGPKTTTYARGYWMTVSDFVEI